MKKIAYASFSDEDFQSISNFIKPYIKANIIDEKSDFKCKFSRASRVVEMLLGLQTWNLKYFKNKMNYNEIKIEKQFWWAAIYLSI